MDKKINVLDWNAIYDPLGDVSIHQCEALGGVPRKVALFNWAAAAWRGKRGHSKESPARLKIETIILYFCLTKLQFSRIVTIDRFSDTKSW